MKARDLMTANPRVVTADDPVSRAARIMRELGVGCTPVVDDAAHMHPSGMLTDRDIVVRCVAEKHAGDCRVGDHMTSGPLTRVTPEVGVADVIALMERDQVRRVLVTEGGRLVGIIAQADVALKEGPVEPLAVERALERLSTPPAP